MAVAVVVVVVTVVVMVMVMVMVVVVTVQPAASWGSLLGLLGSCLIQHAPLAGVHQLLIDLVNAEVAVL